MQQHLQQLQSSDGGEQQPPAALQAADLAAITRQRAALAFTREGAAALEGQVAQLEDSVREARDSSMVELIGRKRLTDRQDAAAAGPA